MPLFDTVSNVISDAAAELGLGTVTDAFASTDPNVVQLRSLLKSVGRRLTKQRQWRQLVKEHTFTTTTDEDTYTLPADFVSMLEQSGWNRTQQLSLAPVDAQGWQYLKATDAGTVLTALFRPRALTLQLWPASPPAGETIAFEYVSRYWVADGETPTVGTRDAFEANTDVLLFDVGLLVPALKLAFQQAKGFDSSAAENEYRMALVLEESADSSGAPKLSLSRSSDFRLVDGANAPQGGYGQ